MTLLSLPSDRFTTEDGYLVRMEVPTQNREQLLDAVRSVTDLKYGDYDGVSFTTSPGIQRFRSLGGGHNPAKDTTTELECVAVTFFLPSDQRVLEKVLRAIYTAHPYEEPVIQIIPAARSLHIRGMDEDNPNRFWNRRNSIREL